MEEDGDGREYVRAGNVGDGRGVGGGRWPESENYPSGVDILHVLTSRYRVLMDSR
jgi:hypothetical protein